MAINFLIENNHNFLDVHIENFRIDIEDINNKYSIYYNKERLASNIQDDIKLINDTTMIKLLTLNIVSLIRDNLKTLNSRYRYNGINIDISKEDVILFNYRVVDLFSDFNFNEQYSKDWVSLLTEILFNLRKYIINLKEIVNGHLFINNVLVQDGDLVKIKNRLHKIERLCISPGNRDICIVKYYFNNEFYVEYESDLIKYISDVSDSDNRLFEDYYTIVADSMSLTDSEL